MAFADEGTIPVEEETSGFTDIALGERFALAVYDLAEQNVLNGYEDGTFAPERTVSRAEAVKILLSSMGIADSEDSIAASAFSDVDSDDWFYSYVGTAMALGIVSGYEDGTFRPHDPVTRAEAVKMLIVAANKESELLDIESIEEAPFADVDNEDWYMSYAQFARTWNIEAPQMDGLWHAGHEMSRGNMAELAYRMQQVLESGETYVESSDWPLVEFTSLNMQMQMPWGWNMSEGELSVIWLKDELDGVSILDPGSNGVVMLVTSLDPNEDYPDNGVVLSIGEVLNLHFTESYGDGDYTEFAVEYVDYMIDSVEYVEPDETPELDTEGILEALREGVQVDGRGSELQALVEDWELIETDAIGVGTGPVDYFYSPGLNYTIKYERSFDVILDIEEGSTTAF